MNIIIVVAVCGLFILLGFEIRHREIIESLEILKIKASAMEKEIIRLNSEMKLKKNIYEEFQHPK